ncbi:magnesium transporter CorA family protein [Paenibacillus sp. JCM 10914]|uniref:magnesium transporter CorA family protein n=1 Tax=Paenibacillus sp. JCM 10914 TaxID=1236974 RepID=UPI0003CC6641|nr:magnesium transporter CorA family protein [Paenibacillus sp. JCM 10914]GAE09410.1 magnesium and cobalt transport protein CorA [Paenibacillus sp. JCM 10914]
MEGQDIYTLAGGWEWYDVRVGGFKSELIGEWKIHDPYTMEWLDLAATLEGRDYLSVRYKDGVEPVLMGSLLYVVTEEGKNQQIPEQFYFYADGSVLITINLDDHTRRSMAKSERVSMLHQCERPVEGLFVLARTILHYYHTGMDRFEVNLRQVEARMRERNRRTLMDAILTARFELLDWSNRFIPFQELLAASREGYHDSLDDSRAFNQLQYRVERLGQLIHHYEREIDTLVSIDDAISGFRGNEIMKTLTIFTVVFTPATVIGAVWGMNFENLPGIETPWGFIVVTGITLAWMGGMYWWLRTKGWTGDLLRVKARKKNKNI